VSQSDEELAELWELEAADQLRRPRIGCIGK
jgi:hypothetical protein